MKRTSSAVALKRIDAIIVWIDTDLPVPVAPAISRCGIIARSAAIGRPAISLPSAIVSWLRAAANSSASMISRR